MAMGWNLVLRMMGSHWVLSKQVTCSVLYVKKIVLDALFRIGEGIRSTENLGAILGETGDNDGLYEVEQWRW